MSIYIMYILYVRTLLTHTLKCRSEAALVETFKAWVGPEMSMKVLEEYG